MDFVEHHVAHEVEARGVFVDEVAEDLGGHHDHGGVVVDRVLAGHQSNSSFAVLAHEVVVFLVAQRLQWRRVDDLGSIPKRAEDRVLGDDRLAAGRRCADEHPAGPGVQLVDRLALERVELEREAGFEVTNQ